MRARAVLIVTIAVSLGALNVAAWRGREHTVTTTTREAGVAAAPTHGAPSEAGAALSNDQSNDELVEHGRNLFRAKGCAACHAEFQVGPSLANLKNRAATTKDGFSAEQYVRESILAPTAFRVERGSGSAGEMPTLPVNADELNALVAYLLTL